MKTKFHLTMTYIISRIISIKVFLKFMNTTLAILKDLDLFLKED